MAAISETERPDHLRIATGWDRRGTPDNPGGVVVERPGSDGIRSIQSIGPDGIIYYPDDFRPPANHRSPLDGDVLPDKV